jgi:hypothetical protein
MVPDPKSPSVDASVCRRSNELDGIKPGLRRSNVTGVIALVIVVASVLYFLSIGPILYALNRWYPNPSAGQLAVLEAYNAPRSWILSHWSWLDRTCGEYDNYWASIGAEHR